MKLFHIQSVFILNGKSREENIFRILRLEQVKILLTANFLHKLRVIYNTIIV